MRAGSDKQLHLLDFDFHIVIVIHDIASLNDIIYLGLD